MIFSENRRPLLGIIVWTGTFAGVKLSAGMDVVLPMSLSVEEVCAMTKIVYHIVEHDGGWAYQVEGAFSETFPSHEAARRAAQRAAAEQNRPGEPGTFSWEDPKGRGHGEVARGDAGPN